jgi:hypothetical protein
MKLQKLFVLCLVLLVALVGCEKEEINAPTSAEDAVDQANAVERWTHPDAGTAPEPKPEGSTVPEGAENLVVNDPLTNGTTIGAVAGGEFTPEGYRVLTNNGGYVMYATDIIRNIQVEFNAKGYIPGENSVSAKLTVLEMFDADPYTPWNLVWRDIDSFLWQLRKRGAGGIVTDALDLKFGCERRHVGKEFWGWRGDCLAGNPIEWDPNKLYRWVVTVSEGRTEVIRNGQLMYSVDSAVGFAPDGPLVVRIGGTSYGAEGPRGVAYSNVKIYRLDR